MLIDAAFTELAVRTLHSLYGLDKAVVIWRVRSIPFRLAARALALAIAVAGGARHALA